MKYAVILCLSLTACSSFPQLDAATPRANIPTPTLLPTEDLLAQTAAIGAEGVGRTLAARAAALRARAAALRNP